MTNTLNNLLQLEAACITMDTGTKTFRIQEEFSDQDIVLLERNLNTDDKLADREFDLSASGKEVIVKCNTLEPEEDENRLD